MAVDGTVVRRFYAAVAARDVDTAAGCLEPDASWRMPGHNVLSGTYIGWDAIRDQLLARLAGLSRGTFRAELLDLTVGDVFVVAVQRATAEREGRSLDVTGCQLMRVRDGLIQEVRGHYSDDAALDAFWGS